MLANLEQVTASQKRSDKLDLHMMVPMGSFIPPMHCRAAATHVVLQNRPVKGCGLTEGGGRWADIHESNNMIHAAVRLRFLSGDIIFAYTNQLHISLCMRSTAARLRPLPQGFMTL